MIVETIFSTVDREGTPNFAPMGVVWGDENILVRPYRNTQTCRNLQLNGCGVACLSDDVLAFVQCGLYDTVLPHFSATHVNGVVFQQSCSWLELAVTSQGGSEEPAEFQCRIQYEGWRRDFLGFCRARSAVIEAAILATRMEFSDRTKAMEALNHYMNIVDKTGDQREKQAIQLVHDYIRKWEAQ